MSHVIVAGMERAGSTFVWQLAKDIYEKSVTKAHGFISAPNKIVFATVRDPRDVIVSFANTHYPHMHNDAALEKAFVEMFLVRKRHRDLLRYKNRGNGSLIIRYEDYFNGNELNLLLVLANCLRVHVPVERREELLQKWSIEENKKRAAKLQSFKQVDSTTQVHGAHISTGGRIGVWRERFSADFAAKVESHLRAFMVAFRYV